MLKRLRLLGWVCLLLLSYTAKAQQEFLSGYVRNAQKQPLEGATVAIEGTTFSTFTNSQGAYQLTFQKVPPLTLVVSYVGYKTIKKEITSLPEGSLYINLELEPSSNQLEEINIKGRKEVDTRETVSITPLDPRLTLTLPSPFADFNKILLTLPGVTNNNELSSSYSVRGGNYDENLVYVNGMEVYRPFLNISGQQEGLSFVNPDLVEGVTFSSGGWQPKYGDKLSSVLDINYRTPTQFKASVSGSLTGGSVHAEGTAAKGRLGYLLGVRHKNAAYVLNSLQVDGNYKPRYTDVQTYLTYDLSNAAHRATGAEPKTELSFLGSIARNNYEVEPTTRETTFGTQGQLLRLLVGYDGQEQLRYTTLQGGLRLKHQFTDNVRGELLYSGVYSQEREFRDLESGYRFCDVEPTPGVSPFNQCASERGLGTQYEYSRNRLRAALQNMEMRAAWSASSRSEFSAGMKVGHEDIEDVLQQYGFSDSSDYVSNVSRLNNELKLTSWRWQGFAQHQWKIDSLHSLTYGVRLHYWSVNKQLSISPRVQYAFHLVSLPQWWFKLAAGKYIQAPLYRELRDQQGNLHPEIKNQEAWHFIAGAEHHFQQWGRPFKLTTEAYYKYMPSVIPFDLDNMRIRYLPQYPAKAYAMGADVRVNGEFINGEESWFSIGFLSTKEDITGDSTIIRDPTTGQEISREERGYIRRPTDQRINFGVYFQDHLPNHPTWKMYLNAVFSSGLPFGPPGEINNRSLFNGTAYRRVDIGFSKLLTLRETLSNRVGLESLWLSLEVLNLIAANNVVSYNYVRDYNGITYAVPNYLTTRMVNVRVIARF